MTLEKFGKLLEAEVTNTGHFKAKEKGFPRIIYGETGRIYISGDGKKPIKRWATEVHYFTREHFDPAIEKLEDLFEKNNIPFDMVAVQYGDTTMDGKNFEKGLIYYLFECEV